ncbi:hypothetical protein EPO44_11970 [bacterium]|nr:MAG: hypothetical protein EPO44_11970 [bacterium]
MRRLLDDAALLYEHQRLPSTLLLLLCAVDALAPRIAGHGRVGERYIAFLTDRLNNYPGAGVKLAKVQILKTGEMLDFAHIIYTYMRNPIVHEGQTLDVRAGGLVAHVVLDFNDKTLVCRSDDPSDSVIVGANWLIGRLFAVLRHELEGS